MMLQSFSLPPLHAVTQMSRILTIACFLIASGGALADDPKKTTSTKEEKKAPAAATEPEEPVGPGFELDKEVKEVLIPLFSSIVKAEVSRSTVEMLADSLLSGTTIESKKATFQIASAVNPDKFTIYMKDPEQRMRLYCDSKTMSVAMSPTAYFDLPSTINTQEAATNLPVPMGPYPEPLLALTLAGVDPAISLISGMKSIEIVDRKKFRDTVDAVHLRGVQADDVSWDFWVTDEKQPEPLRFLVDLTPMLIASQDVNVPSGYSYQVRYDFVSWRVTGEIDDKLFVYSPTEDAEKFDSLAHYYETISSATAEHPMLGKKIPRFRARNLDGDVVDSKDLAGKVIVMDFWATWCTPCLESMPVIKEVSDEFGDKDVVFIALNTGEETKVVQEFLKEHDLEADVLLDPEGKIADAFAADAIPQTVLIGKTGAVESVHVGFAGAEAMKQRLQDELEVLSIGGLIGSVPADAKQKDAAAEKSDKKPAKKK